MHSEIYFPLIILFASAFATSVVDIKKDQENGRLLVAQSNIFTFTTFTLLKQTTTTISTFTSTATCTTSTATLTTCTIGRRRRGLFYDEAEIQGRSRRGLFYDDEEVGSNDSNTFLVSEKKNTEFVENIKTAVDEVLIPLELESGFTLPSGGPNRFLLSFGTSTVTSITIATQTISLTAFCSSTTGFPLCVASGK